MWTNVRAVIHTEYHDALKALKSYKESTDYDEKIQTMEQTMHRVKRECAIIGYSTRITSILS